ncbi:MAG: integrase core domain-containing protein [Syntrophales bacterium]
MIGKAHTNAKRVVPKSNLFILFLLYPFLMPIRFILKLTTSYRYCQFLESLPNKIEAWRVDYNEYRPHGSLDYKTPSDFARSGLFEAGKLTAWLVQFLENPQNGIIIT